MFISVDNPKKGNCAFYAYGIALIDIIKHESQLSRSHTFDTWTILDPTINDLLPFILNFNYKKQNVKLLEILQASLRKIVFDSQLNLLKDEANKEPLDYYIQQNSIYIKFKELVLAFLGGYCDPDYNELASSRAVKSIARDLASRISQFALTKPITEEQVNHAITMTFLRDVYGGTYLNSPEGRLLNEHNSAILSGLKRITINYYWGRFDDLNILSEKFGVNFHCLTDGHPNSKYQFHDEPGKPIVTLNHEDDDEEPHWTTQLTTSLSIENCSTKNYQRFCTDSLLTKKEIQKIYKTYTTGFIAFFGRNHMAKGRELISLCDDENRSVEDIVIRIKEYITDKSIHFNHDSSFMKRANYILARYEYYNGYQDTFDTNISLRTQ